MMKIIDIMSITLDRSLKWGYLMMIRMMKKEGHFRQNMGFFTFFTFVFFDIPVFGQVILVNWCVISVNLHFFSQAHLDDEKWAKKCLQWVSGGYHEFEQVSLH
jgi:hypothetical protein